MIALPAAVLVLAGFALLARSQRSETQAAGDKTDFPQACLSRLLAAEQKGDPAAYLACFEGSQRDRLRVLWTGRSESDVSAELQKRSVGLVGHSIGEIDFPVPDRACVMLERITKDHHERQRVELLRQNGRWTIAELSTPDWSTPVIPYGTPVFSPKVNAPGDRP